ncbi:universal stress family protein [Lyngbya aestuarii BL J]|uniref:Universal stress family protein n=1 Tax=Lyngbya aestuarii BL J TaxID=1348334 RepID=U7QRH3_9CYAN|nr:universal stress protein [Lyngbya aestuarii]ERT09011.1 universal stress family protein [Lyngbya aestuarii BL J]
MSAIEKNCVVVPVDFGELSLTAIATALEYVKSPNQIHAVHILEALQATDPAMIWNTLDDEVRKNNAHKKLEEVLNQPEHQGIQIYVEIGHPSEKIVDFSQEKNADLIVIPTHGRRGISRFMLGSVTERVIRFAQCPVLVLR